MSRPLSGRNHDLSPAVQEGRLGCPQLQACCCNDSVGSVREAWTGLCNRSLAIDGQMCKLQPVSCNILAMVAPFKTLDPLNINEITSK